MATPAQILANRAYYRVLNVLTKLQKERRAEEEAAAFERTWLDSLKEPEQQAAETKERPHELGSFRKTGRLRAPALVCSL